MGLQGFSGGSDDSSGGPTKTTYYQFENPDHSETKEFDDPDRARRHFRAARYVQDQLGTDRHNLAGEFLYAVQQLDKEGDEEPLQNLVEELTE